jgi:hypothetical protein
MQASRNCSAGAEPWYDMRWGLGRNRLAGFSGVRDRYRALLETRLMGIVVGTILVEVRKTIAALYRAM